MHGQLNGHMALVLGAKERKSKIRRRYARRTQAPLSPLSPGSHDGGQLPVAEV